jgi:hypothetical protein
MRPCNNWRCCLDGGFFMLAPWREGERAVGRRTTVVPGRETIVCKHHCLSDGSQTRSGQRSKPAACHHKASPSAAVRCSWPAPKGSQRPPLPATSAAMRHSVRNAIHDFHQRGLAALHPKSSRPHTTHEVFDAQGREQLRALIHQSPRTFGKDTSIWTLDLAAEVSVTMGIASRPISGETIRNALAQLGVHWKRAKHWIASAAQPPATPSAHGCVSSHLWCAGTRLITRSTVPPSVLVSVMLSWLPPAREYTSYRTSSVFVLRPG